MVGNSSSCESRAAQEPRAAGSDIHKLNSVIGIMINDETSLVLDCLGYISSLNLTQDFKVVRKPFSSPKQDSDQVFGQGRSVCVCVRLHVHHS